MKPAAFSYVVPASETDALDALAPDGAKVVAGNQSLGPMLNLRLARPDTLVDLGALGGLRDVGETDTHVRYGAGVTHAEIEDGDVPDATPGWLQAVAGNIAYRAVRNRGTLGGSLCHADPAADWVVVMTALGATAIVLGRDGERRMPVAQFITGPYMNALGTGEILSSVEVPKPGPGAAWGYWKYVRQPGDFAKASAAILLDPANGVSRCVVGALGGPPAVVSGAQDFLDGKVSSAEMLQTALTGRELGALPLHRVALDRVKEALT